MKITSRKFFFMVTTACLAFGCAAIFVKSTFKHMNVAYEARVFSKYLWREKGNFELACHAITKDPPEIGSSFVKNWAPVLHSPATQSSVVAYRTKSSNGKTFVILNDYRIDTRNTEQWEAIKRGLEEKEKLKVQEM